jgi:hypothetical protein
MRATKTVCILIELAFMMELQLVGLILVVRGLGAGLSSAVAVATRHRHA